MSIRVEIHDEGSGLLQQIAIVSHEAGLEALSKSGFQIQQEARKSLRSKKHHWVKEFVDGSFRMRFDKTQTRELGQRISHKDGSAKKPSSMESFISYYLMPKSGVVVVGGMHPAFNPMRFRDGKFTGYMKREQGVGKQSYAMLHKMNTGEKNSDYEEGYASDKPVAYEFMDEGFRKARPKIREIMTVQMERTVGKRMNAEKVKIRKIIA